MNREGRGATAPHSIALTGPETFTGNRALDLEEGLIFEIGRMEVTGVDIAEPAPFRDRLGTQARTAPLDLPGLSEPEAMRHYVRLSRMNYGIDSGLFPLGSCTMKHNPRLNEKMARLPGFADIHPLQPQSTVKGALGLMAELSRYLLEIDRHAAVALSPKAGAHGELCGMMAIKAARGQGRCAPSARRYWCPNRRTAPIPRPRRLIGFKVVKPIPARADGTVDPEAVKAAAGAPRWRRSC